jgi:hypothetical protein
VQKRVQNQDASVNAMLLENLPKAGNRSLSAWPPPGQVNPNKRVCCIDPVPALLQQSEKSIHGSPITQIVGPSGAHAPAPGSRRIFFIAFQRSIAAAVQRWSSRRFRGATANAL